MSYVVLARRYRPQTFSDLIGQDHVAKTLKNAIAQGRTHHAYLFAGPRGTGKTSSARILAKALRCLNPKDHEPCNQCDACEQINLGTSLDVIEIDAASNNGVDNIRDLRENIGFAATIGKVRVYIVDEVHMLSTAAFNALLKTLEEPPPHVVFILATTELHKVPATILSRCQRFDFKKVPHSILREKLQDICRLEKVEIDSGALQTILNEADGCVRDAESLLDRAIALCGKKIEAAELSQALGLMDREAFLRLMDCVISQDPKQALQMVHEILEKGTDPKALLQRMVDFVRELHYFRFVGSSLVDDTLFTEAISRLSQKASVEQLVASLDLVLTAQGSLGAQMNAVYLVESLVAKLSLVVTTLGASRASQATQSLESSSRESVPSRPLHPAPLDAKVTSAHGAAAHGAATKTATPIGAGGGSTPHAVPTKVASSGPANASGPLLEQLSQFIRKSKPAWTPVLASIESLTQNGDQIRAVVRADFAGKRLASSDGKTLLERVFANKNIVVDIGESAVAEPRLTYDDKKKMATQDKGVQSALKAFGSAEITETKILEDNHPTRRNR